MQSSDPEETPPFNGPMASRKALVDVASKVLNLTNWIKERTLPFWSTAGFNSMRGCFFERMDWTGQPTAEGEDRLGSFAFSVDSHGSIVSDVRDAYAHAFVLFAIAWLYRLNGERHLLTIAEKTIAFIDANLEDPVHSGVFDTFPLTDRCKRQNPHMHLLEAYLALEISAPGMATSNAQSNSWKRLRRVSTIPGAGF